MLRDGLCWWVYKGIEAFEGWDVRFEGWPIRFCGCMDRRSATDGLSILVVIDRNRKPAVNEMVVVRVQDSRCEYSGQVKL